MDAFTAYVKPAFEHAAKLAAIVPVWMLLVMMDKHLLGLPVFGGSFWHSSRIPPRITLKDRHCGEHSSHSDGSRGSGAGGGQGHEEAAAFNSSPLVHASEDVTTPKNAQPSQASSFVAESLPVQACGTTALSLNQPLEVHDPFSSSSPWLEPGCVASAVLLVLVIAFMGLIVKKARSPLGKRQVSEARKTSDVETQSKCPPARPNFTGNVKFWMCCESTFEEVGLRYPGKTLEDSIEELQLPIAGWSMPATAFEITSSAPAPASTSPPLPTILSPALSQPAIVYPEPIPIPPTQNLSLPTLTSGETAPLASAPAPTPASALLPQSTTPSPALSLPVNVYAEPAPTPSTQTVGFPTATSVETMPSVPASAPPPAPALAPLSRPTISPPASSEPAIVNMDKTPSTPTPTLPETPYLIRSESVDSGNIDDNNSLDGAPATGERKKKYKMRQNKKKRIAKRAAAEEAREKAAEASKNPGEETAEVQGEEEEQEGAPEEKPEEKPEEVGLEASEPPTAVDEAPEANKQKKKKRRRQKRKHEVKERSPNDIGCKPDHLAE